MAARAASTSLRKAWPRSPPKWKGQLGYAWTLRCVLQGLCLRAPAALGGAAWEVSETWGIHLRAGTRASNVLLEQRVSCSTGTRVCEHPLDSKGLRVLVSAGPLPAQRPTWDQVRPGERGTLHKSSSHPEPNSPYLRAKESPVPQFRPGPCPLQTVGDLPD